MKVLKKIFIVFYIIIAVELFFRIFYPRAMLPRYIAATEFGIRGNQKNAEYTHKAPEYKVHIKINSKGARSDKEIPYAKTDTTIKRVVLLGDSFGLGYGVNLEESFPEIMRKELNKSKINIEVINLAVSGHGNAEELIMLKNEGLKYHPDLVILQFHHTDYKDNVRSNLYALEHDSLVRKNKKYLPAVKSREKLFSYPLYRWIASNSHTYTWAREILAGKVKKALVKKNKQSEIKDQEDITTNQMVEKTPDSLTIALIKEMGTTCKKNNCEFLVFDTPRKIKRGEYNPSYDTNFNDELPGIHYVLPINEMLKYGTDNKLYWEKAHGHFTPLGTSIVGKELAKYIIKNKLL